MDAQRIPSIRDEYGDNDTDYDRIEDAEADRELTREELAVLYRADGTPKTITELLDEFSP